MMVSDFAEVPTPIGIVLFVTCDNKQRQPNRISRFQSEEHESQVKSRSGPNLNKNSGRGGLEADYALFPNML